MSISDSTAALRRPVRSLSFRQATLQRWGAFLLAGAALVAVMTTHLLDFGVDNLKSDLLNANLSSSWSHVVDAATLVAGALVALVIFRRASVHRRTWGVVLAILAFLAIDEVSPLHTSVDQMSWGKALYAPLLIVLCVCLWRLSAQTDWGVPVRAGLVTLVVSFGVHVFGPHVVHALGWGTNSWAYQVKVAIKQGTELAGWLLVVSGLWQLASREARRSKPLA